jgi:enamine deaminase RidA (YjgF/YER057c/UK114 family)
VSEGDIEGQTRQVLQNLRAILEDAGGSLDDVMKITTYLRNREHHPRVHEIRREFFGDAPPASTTVEITGLFDTRQLIEMEAIAVLPVPASD